MTDIPYCSYCYC